MAAKLKDVPGMISVLQQLVIDQFVYFPVVYFPVFYTCKELAATNDNGENPVTSALTKYRHNAVEDLQATWAVWVPISIVNFAAVPMHLRVPFIATIGIGWCAFLSYTRGGPQLNQAAEELKHGLARSGVDLKLELQKLHRDAVGFLGEDSMNREQFGQIMARLFQHTLSQPVTASLYDAFDTKGDGKISTLEFVDGVSILLGLFLSLSPSLPARLRSLVCVNKKIYPAKTLLAY